MKTLLLILTLFILLPLVYFQFQEYKKFPESQNKKEYWLMLQRKSNKEYLYFGEPGGKHTSALVKVFKVKSGIPQERPTPLPKLLGKDYFLITQKFETFDNPETSPYFLTLNIPMSENPPFGPRPYLECNGQCNWRLPGAFGLHGVGGDLERLSNLNPGSSGCVRHSDEDITYLYNLLELEKEPVRYYIEDV